jgi:hypothetical protein
MKHLKKFENFYLSPDVDSENQEIDDYSQRLRFKELDGDSEEEISDVMPDEISSEEEFGHEGSFSSEEEEGDWNEEEDYYDSSEEEEGDAPLFSEEGKHIMSFEESNSYKKSKKKAKPDFLDLDKDGDKKESMKKAAKDAKSKGLTPAQKKLPEGLRKAIEARKKK